MIHKEDILLFYKPYVESGLEIINIDSEEELSKLPNDTLMNIHDSVNQIKKVDSNEYMFIRKGSINTVKHISSNLRDSNHAEIVSNLTKSLDNDLKYADERIDLSNYLIDKRYKKELGDLVSDPQIIRKEHKSKKDFLSEDKPLDSRFEKLGTYILFPKFCNESEEMIYNSTKEVYSDLKKKSLSGRELKHFLELETALDNLDMGLLSKNQIKMNKIREIYTNKHDELEQEDLGFSPTHFKVGTTIPKWHRHYFKKMGFSDWKERNYIVLTYLRAIKDINKQLGFHLTSEERESYQEEYEKKLRPKTIEVNGKTYSLSPSQIMYRLFRMRNEIISDYKIVLEKLMTIISFQDPTKPTTIYNYDFNTYYEQDGEDIFVSENKLRWSDVETYKNLLKYYAELKHEHADNFQHDMWAILYDFEELVRDSPLTHQERFITKWIMYGFDTSKIGELYEQEFNTDFSRSTFYDRVNKTIPKKLLNTYLDRVDEWIYTYKLFGDFKKCSSCGEIKLISNDRYFTPRSDGKGDGYYNSCKKCEKVRKTP